MAWSRSCKGSKLQQEGLLFGATNATSSLLALDLTPEQLSRRQQTSERKQYRKLSLACRLTCVRKQQPRSLANRSKAETASQVTTINEVATVSGKRSHLARHHIGQFRHGHAKPTTASSLKRNRFAWLTEESSKRRTCHIALSG